MGLLLAVGTLASVGVAGVGLRLLLAARAADAAIAPHATLILGRVASGAIGLAFTPFALVGSLPTALGVVVFVLVMVALASTVGAWTVLRRVL
ncbi:MAG: hypothetical protein F4Y54_10940 [Dehalococcoidia bacterium]|nr:hypothetical protein [Dehalococcoidia bacterium]